MPDHRPVGGLLLGLGLGWLALALLMIPHLHEHLFHVREPQLLATSACNWRLANAPCARRRL